MDGLRGLLPAFVEVEQTTFDGDNEIRFVEEQAIVKAAIPSRTAEFLTARACAHRALSCLGFPPAPIMMGPNREPLWPKEVVGSITHCRGYRGAAVASSHDAVTVGIDAEIHEALPKGVLQLISVQNERRHLGRLARSEPNVAWDRLLFSAKESFYKAWFPITGIWLGFADCEITFDLREETFFGRLAPGLRSATARAGHFTGRWAVEDDHIFTAICEPAS